MLPDMNSADNTAEHTCKRCGTTCIRRDQILCDLCEADVEAENTATAKHTERAADGTYTDGFDAMCECGHTKGLHTAARPHECIAGDFGHEHCNCPRFKRAKGTK